VFEPGLTVCLIVRDERENLASRLAELAATADDVIVVDTDPDDATPVEAYSAGVRVYEYPRSDDSAGARNRALDEVRTSHALCLDVTDHISARDLTALRKEVGQRTSTAFELIVVNESGDPNTVTSCCQVRVVPVRPEHRFEGRVHERIRPALERTRTSVMRVPLVVRHTGSREPGRAIREAHRHLDHLRREVDEGRDDAGLLYELAQAASQAGHLDEARRVAQRCVETQSSDVDAIQAAAILLGHLELERGDTAKAERVLREAVQRRPDDAFARFSLGDLLRRANDFPGALRELTAARAAPLRRSSVPVPVAGLARTVRLRLGAVLEILDRPAEAAVAYREILDDWPDEPGASRALVRALIRAGAWDEAERQLTRLADDSAEDPDVTLLAAHLAFARNHEEEAARLFARALELDPENWAAPLHLGHLALRQGDISTAFDHYSRARALADEPEVRVGLAAARLEQGEIREALDELEAVFDQCSGRPLPRGTEAMAGEALLRIGRADDARRAFERHLERLGPDARVVSRLADCYRELDAPEAARFGYEEALKLEPGLPEAARGLGALDAVS
jgi:tetratricopeptide (TPR) repeat protein